LQHGFECEVAVAHETAAPHQLETLRYIEARGIAHRVDEAQRLGRLTIAQQRLHHLDRDFEIATAGTEIDRGGGRQRGLLGAAPRADQRQLDEAADTTHRRAHSIRD
jgi:hypothetical protein